MDKGLYLVAGCFLVSMLGFIAHQVRSEIYRDTDFINHGVISSVEDTHQKAKLDAGLSNQEASDQSNMLTEQNAVIAERDLMMTEFAIVLKDLSLGQKPEPLQLMTLLKNQQTLVDQQAMTTDEAMANIDFLRKVMPELNSDLERFAQQLQRKQI